MRQLSRLVARLAIAIPVAGGLFVSAVRASDGALDTTGFGTGGIVTTDVGPSGNNFASSLAIQSDGKLVVAGVGYASSYGTYDFAIVRYQTDGTLDSDFSGDGITTTDTNPGLNDYAISMAIQPDGKIVAAGIKDAGGNNDFSLVRYNGDGSLDTDFSEDGFTSIGFGGSSNDVATSVQIQPDGKIVIAGYTNVNAQYDFVIVRYNTNGTLDTGFGIGGHRTTSIGTGGDDYANSLALQKDGKLLVAGIGNATSPHDFAIVRYRADGNLDPTFGNGGITSTFIRSNGGTDFINSMILLPNGKIVVAGNQAELQGGINDFIIARYSSGGILDPTFGDAGLTTTSFGEATDDYANAVALQRDGKILVAGYSDASGDLDFALARFNVNGVLDTTFGAGGITKTGIDSRSRDYVSGSGIAVQSDGNVVITGSSDAGGNYRFVLARYNATTLTATLASGSTTSNSASITFTVTGTGTIDCSSLSMSAGVDFDLAGITAITSITQTSSTVCTIAATSSAIPDGVAVTSTLTAASSFSVVFTNGNSQSSMSGSPRSVVVSVPATATTPTTPATTASSTTSTAASTTSTATAITTTIPVAPALPVTGDDSSTASIFGLLLVLTGLVLTSRRRINR